MRLIILSICAILLFAVVTRAGDYCSGWENGYVAGWCYQRAACVTPAVPPCPAEGFDEDSYQDGYNRGFATALSRRR